MSMIYREIPRPPEPEDIREPVKEEIRRYDRQVKIISLLAISIHVAIIMYVLYG